VEARETANRDASMTASARSAEARDREEEEIDLAAWASAIAARWWLLLVGLVAGLALGWVLSVGAGEVYRAQALLYLGEPLTPSGGAQVQGLATNPSTVREITRSEAVVQRVARTVGLTPAELRRGTSVQAASGNVARVGQTPLVNVSVKGGPRRKVAQAANELARAVVQRVSPYVDAKIATLKVQIASAGDEISSLDARIDAATAVADDRSLSATERLVALTNAGVLEQRRAIAVQTRADRQALLALAEQVEKPRVVEPAAAREVTARSRRNSLVVGGAIGLLIGLGAALLWDRIRPAP
jgi:uncharacterized protein involved in exopolysaccharide biosynthesis